MFTFALIPSYVIEPQKAVRHEDLTNVQSLFADKWYDIGLELLHPRDEIYLKSIRTGKHETIESCTKMLDLWLDRQPNATWNQLIDALRSPGVELFDVASTIEDLLKGKFSVLRILAYTYKYQEKFKILQSIGIK